MKTILSAAFAAASLCLCAADPVFQGLVDAQEVRARQGVGNFMAKIKAGKEVTVAYLGGSITAMGGWRNMTTDWLSKTFPNAKFKEVHASIGGTGSGLGVFRVGHDALRHNPDLLFIEFATNDFRSDPKHIWENFEGIIRQTWRKDPTTDIVFTYTFTHVMRDDYMNGKCNRSASAMEQIADFYGIPTVCFGPRIVDLIKQNKLVVGDSEFATAVPMEDPERDRKIKEMRKNDKRILFSNDNVHPRKEGHLLYLESIKNAFTQMKDSKPVDHRKKLSKVFIASNLENAKMVDLEPYMFSGSWRQLSKDDQNYKSFNARLGNIWHSGVPGDTIRFKFKGTKCAIYDLLAPNGGQILITVDGKPHARPSARFDSYCTYTRIATMHVFGGADGVHEVELKIDSKQPSREPVAFRLKDPKTELASPKYQGFNFWPAKIMLIGDLVK